MGTLLEAYSCKKYIHLNPSTLVPRIISIWPNDMSIWEILLKYFLRDFTNDFAQSIFLTIKTGQNTKIPQTFWILIRLHLSLETLPKKPYGNKFLKAPMAVFLPYLKPQEVFWCSHPKTHASTDNILTFTFPNAAVVLPAASRASVRS